MTRLLFLALACCAAGVQAAPPCVSASPDCTEWIPLKGGPARSLVYRSYSLETRDADITRAFILVHDADRDAADYFRTGLAAAFLAGALNDTVVIAPRFASNDGRGCRDALDSNEVSWPCDGDSWRSGGTSPSNEDLTSFDFADEILRILAKKTAFPNLKAIVVAGHSAGGQFVTRYEMANQVDRSLGVRVSYVVSNPSSYAYPDALRPDSRGGFAAFADRRNCTAFDNWPYGFENRTGYTAKISDEDLKRQLAARPTTYLLGEIDILPLGGFDSSCPAMAQGPTRLARGIAFGKLVNANYGAHHQVVIIPLCGHNARCMFTSDPALPVIFPND